MESMLNKLKSTVTKVTADVTSAVMGNPVTREFEVGRHIASGGPGMSWRIYNGTKKSTKQVCGLFIIVTSISLVYSCTVSHIMSRLTSVFDVSKSFTVKEEAFNLENAQHSCVE